MQDLRPNQQVLCYAPHYPRPLDTTTSFGYKQTNSSCNPSYPIETIRILARNKSKKNQPQATQSKRNPNIDPVPGKWLLQPAGTVNLYIPRTSASTYWSTPTSQPATKISKEMFLSSVQRPNGRETQATGHALDFASCMQRLAILYCNNPHVHARHL